MNKDKKPNVPLIVGIGVPVLMMLFVAAAIYLPGLFQKPQFDFVYSSGQTSWSSPALEVKNQKLTYQCADSQSYYSSDGTAAAEIAAKCTEEFLPKLYRHSIKENKSTEISYADAQKLILNSSADSPDGYKVEQGDYSGDMFSGMFGGSNDDYRSWFLKGHNRRTKLNLIIDTNSPYDLKFVGWIKE